MKRCTNNLAVKIHTRNVDLPVVSSFFVNWHLDRVRQGKSKGPPRNKKIKGTRLLGRIIYIHFRTFENIDKRITMTVGGAGGYNLNPCRYFFKAVHIQLNLDVIWTRYDFCIMTAKTLL